MDDESQDSSYLGTNLKTSIGSHSRLKPKKVMFIRGYNSNLVTTLLMRDFNRLKKSHSVYLKEKFDIKPFEDASTIEELALEHKCPLFIFSSHNKKRPNNLIIGRLSEEDQSMKEMVEFGIDNVRSMQEIKGPKLPANSRLCLSFTGSTFQECNDYRLFKELFSEFFQGHVRDSDKLSKVDYFVKLTGDKEVSRFECTRVIPRYKSSKVCKIEYEDLGPNFDFSIRRVKLFTSDVLMDIPEEIPDEIVTKTDSSDQPEPSESNLTTNNNKSPNSKCDNVDYKKADRGVKRHQDDLNEQLKRMKFVD